MPLRTMNIHTDIKIHRSGYAFAGYKFLKRSWNLGILSGGKGQLTISFPFIAPLQIACKTSNTLLGRKACDAGQIIVWQDHWISERFPMGNGSVLDTNQTGQIYLKDCTFIMDQDLMFTFTKHTTYWFVKNIQYQLSFRVGCFLLFLSFQVASLTFTPNRVMREA